jgi:hypothetical protein
MGSAEPRHDDELQMRAFWTQLEQPAVPCHGRGTPELRRLKRRRPTGRL